MLSRTAIFLLLYSVYFVNDVSSVKFEPFVPTESYKCGVFLQNSINDEAMHYYYGWINHFIRLLSKPFPHQDLISQQAISGNENAWKDSFIHKYPLVRSFLMIHSFFFQSFGLYHESLCGVFLYIIVAFLVVTT